MDSTAHEKQAGACGKQLPQMIEGFPVLVPWHPWSSGYDVSLTPLKVASSILAGCISRVSTRQWLVDQTQKSWLLIEKGKILVVRPGLDPGISSSRGRRLIH